MPHLIGVAFMLVFIFTSFDGMSYEVLICDNCEASSDFEMLASSTQEHHTVVIINTVSRVTKSYNVLNEPQLGGFLAIEIPLPSEIVNSLSEAIQVIQGAEMFLSLLSPPVNLSSQPNGCGGADDPINVLIPQEPFLQACNAHDICYANGVARNLCDTAFLADMTLIIEERVEKLKNSKNDFLVELHKNLLLKKLRDAFFAFVDEFGAQFYCKDGLNSETNECKSLEAQSLGNEIEFLSITGQSAQQVGSFNGFQVNIVCDIVTYRIYINGEAGTVNIIENCRVADF